MMVRRDVFEALGGFDERLFMYAEDTDLCYRIRRGGGMVRYLPGERVLHHGAASSAKKKRDHFGPLMQRESNLYFMREHFGPGAAVAYRAAVGAGSLLRMGAAVALTPARPVLPRRLASVRGAFDKYRALALWSIGLRKARVSH
jgi:hypothetical protein